MMQTAWKWELKLKEEENLIWRKECFIKLIICQ